MRIIDADALKENRWVSDCLEVVWVKDIDEAPTIKTKQIKYYDEDENVWKTGSVIVDE